MIASSGVTPKRIIAKVVCFQRPHVLIESVAQTFMRYMSQKIPGNDYQGCLLLEPVAKDFHEALE